MIKTNTNYTNRHEYIEFSRFVRFERFVFVLIIRVRFSLVFIHTIVNDSGA